MTTSSEIFPQFESALKDFLQKTRAIKPTDEEKLVFFRPIIGEHGFKKIKQNSEVYYTKYVQNNKDEFIIVSSYSEAIKKLTQFIQSNFKSIQIKDQKKLAEKLLLQFFVSYLRESSNFKFKKIVFKKIFSSFEANILCFLDLRIYFTPLHNLKGNFDQIKLSNDLQIRKITSKEFTKVADLKKTTSDSFGGLNEYPTRFLYNLLYVLEFKTQNTGNIAEIPEKVKSKFDHTISIMKLYGTGDLRTGAIYHQPVNEWENTSIKRIGDENPQIGQTKFILSQTHVKKFLSFFKKSNSIDLSDNNRTFLRIALRRFSQAISDKEFTDKVIDFWIALEALYHTPHDKMELSYRIATRSAILLGNNDEERKNHYGFHKDCYTIRSNIVHTGSIGKMKIIGKKEDEEYILLTLESVTREAILRFMSLCDSNTKKQEEILKEIDIATLDTKALKKLQKTSKKFLN